MVSAEWILSDIPIGFFGLMDGIICYARKRLQCVRCVKLGIVGIAGIVGIVGIDGFVGSITVWFLLSKSGSRVGRHLVIL